jgi:hypothetical protein
MIIMIEYHNPAGQVAVELEPYALSASVTGGKKISIGFLANGFPDSENFLNEVQKAMQALEPGIEVHSYNKGNASMSANEEMISKIKSECQAVVAAYGH